MAIANKVHTIPYATYIRVLWSGRSPFSSSGPRQNEGTMLNVKTA